MKCLPIRNCWELFHLKQSDDAIHFHCIFSIEYEILPHWLEQLYDGCLKSNLKIAIGDMNALVSREAEQLSRRIKGYSHCFRSGTGPGPGRG